MRIHLRINSTDKIIPFDHQPLLTGTIHKWLGWNNEHGKVSLYSFSQLTDGKVVCDGFKFNTGTSLFFSSYDSDLIRRLISGIQSDLNLETITQKWQSFVDDVCKEKSFLLTPLFNTIKPINFDGINLHLESSDPNTESSIQLHQEYIDKKSRDFFGKKINLRFGADFKSQIQPKNEKAEKNQKTAKSSKNLDPYEKIIIEELGGQEIN